VTPRRTSQSKVRAAVDLASPSRRARSRQRLAALVSAFEGAKRDSAVAAMSTRELVASAFTHLAVPTAQKLWLTLAVLKARYPLAEDVLDARRIADLYGPGAVLAAAILPTPKTRYVPVRPGSRVTILRDSVLVDVDHTSTVAFATGIQRVVRETVKRWVRDHDLVLVGWNEERSALRILSAAESHKALTGESIVSEATPRGTVPDVVVPLGGAYVLPELTLDRRVAFRIAAMSEASSTSAAVIGFDAVPLSSSETVDFMVSGGFASNLSAVKHMDRVAAISEAAATEYRGWREMLAGAGIVGPDVTAFLLPHEPLTTSRPAPDDAAIELGISRDVPFVLCVGSHEPRKNHLAVLHAAETLWREGHDFQLMFVGGNAWNSGLFSAKYEELVGLGRSVSNVRALSDELLAAAYDLATFTVFASLNEGYGLPVVESLAAGTPVVTSGYGSMLEITATGGAVYVDPRSDSSVCDGIRSLLVDAELVARLVREALAQPVRTWDEYAAETWSYLVEG
jgi:glycosyltransferase involved in cell wall biosynthesis